MYQPEQVKYLSRILSLNDTIGFVELKTVLLLMGVAPLLSIYYRKVADLEIDFLILAQWSI